jgi:hypothetical protein
MVTKLMKTPTWILGGGWGINVDPSNWILCQEVLPIDKTRKSSWKQVSYHANPQQLFGRLLERICAQEPLNKDLITHITKSQAATQKLAAKFAKACNFVVIDKPK